MFRKCVATREAFSLKIDMSSFSINNHAPQTIYNASCKYSIKKLAGNSDAVRDAQENVVHAGIYPSSSSS